MSYWMKPGSFGPSDIDHYAALGILDERCPTCLQVDCECCAMCGVAPFADCHQDCRCASCVKRRNLSEPIEVEPCVAKEKTI